MNIYESGQLVADQKPFRQGQILKLIVAETITSQEQLRRRLSQERLRVTQATLSRDLRELKLVKTSEGYKPLATGGGEVALLPPLAQTAREFLRDMRPAQNLLVLKTPPSGAQPLAAALDAQHWKEVLGTIAGDDTILIITPSQPACRAIQQRLKDLLR